MAWPRLSPKARTQVKRIKAEMALSGVRLRVHKSALIRSDGDECSGYFDAGRMVVAVGAKKSEAEFLAVLFHEYVHFCQWRDHQLGRRTRLGKAWQRSSQADAIGAKGLSRTERYEAYRALLELERQAEVGMLRMLEEGGYGDAPTLEIISKCAALYLYTHRLMFEKRRWFREGHGDLYEWLKDVNIWRATPTTLRGVDFNRIPPKLKRLLLRLF